MWTSVASVGSLSTGGQCFVDAQGCTVAFVHTGGCVCGCTGVTRCDVLNRVLEHPYLQDLGGGGGNFYAAGNLEAGQADDFAGGIAQHHHISFVQVLKLYI